METTNNAVEKMRVKLSRSLAARADRLLHREAWDYIGRPRNVERSAELLLAWSEAVMRGRPLPKNVVKYELTYSERAMYAKLFN